jgi:hypothetical protein
VSRHGPQGPPPAAPRGGRDPWPSAFRLERTQVSLGIREQLTAVDRARIRYVYGFFDSDHAASVQTHSVRLGYDRRLTALTVIPLEGGPRSVDGATDADALAELEDRLRLATVLLGYARSRASFVGRVGARTTDRVFTSTSSPA